MKSQPRKNAMILFPTNGVGFGHFTRMYAIAREMRKKDLEHGNNLFYYNANSTYPICR